MRSSGWRSVSVYYVLSVFLLGLQVSNFSNFICYLLVIEYVLFLPFRLFLRSCGLIFDDSPRRSWQNHGIGRIIAISKPWRFFCASLQKRAPNNSGMPCETKTSIKRFWALKVPGALLMSSFSLKHLQARWSCMLNSKKGTTELSALWSSDSRLWQTSKALRQLDTCLR